MLSLGEKYKFLLRCALGAAVGLGALFFLRSDDKSADQSSDVDGTPAFAFSENGINRAILIGVDDYFGADQSHDLKYASADVELMRERLLGLGFHPENIVALSTANGTKAPEFKPNLANVEKALADRLAKTRPNDSIFVFFTGHGFQTRKFFGLNNYVGFVVSDSARRADGRLDVSTTFSLSKFFNKLAKTEARFKWAVVDACRETLGPETAKGGMKSAALGDRLGVLKARSGLLIFQSCGDGQYSYEDETLKHSAFTYRLAESLGPEGDTNGDGAIKFLEAISRTTDKMADVKPRQEPALSCVETRDFVLLINTEPTETPVAKQTPETNETPVAKQTPESTETPEVAQTPESTETPEVAQAPESNETPVAKQTQANAEPTKTEAATGDDVQTTSASRTPESESARLYRLGRALAFGLDGRKIDEAAGFERLKQATDLGSLDAQAELAELYLNGCVGTKADPDEAFDLATAPAQAGNPFGQNVLALCYRDGLSPQRDEAKAEACFKDACVGFRKRAESDVRAATALGEHYLNGEGVVKDEKAAADLFLAAAEADYVPAMRWLGACYAKGIGVDQDDKLAWKWLLKAAELNDTLAMTTLGACYASGIVVEQNAEEAAKWWLKAAELENATAMTALGACYASGLGVEQNAEEAAKWRRKAAELENAALVRMLELESQRRRAEYEAKLAMVEREQRRVYEAQEYDAMKRVREMDHVACLISVSDYFKPSDSDFNFGTLVLDGAKKDEADERGSASGDVSEKKKADEKGRSLAVLVGVDEKRDEKAVTADVEKLRDMLAQIGFAPENVVVLTNEKADAQAIRQTLDVAFRSTVPGDALFLFFLGRCESVEVDGKTRSFFLPFGADASDLETTALDLDELTAKTRETAASRKTLFFDVDSRKPPLEKTLTEGDAVSPTKNGGFACLVLPFEEARQNDASGEGVFTRLLAEATNELAAENDGATVKELLERLSAKINENGADRARTPFQWRLTSDFPIIAPKESDENDEK